jgi:ABC-2 type transport system ATP-binding protein
MEEAQRLADRVVVIARGRVIAEGTPDSLAGTDNPSAIVSYRRHGELIRFHTETPTRDLAPLIAQATERGEELEGLTVSRPSLEDVYLQLTAEEAA